MKSRIAIWAAVGFLVAGCWGIYAFVTPPGTMLVHLREPLVQVAMHLTCPISYLGRHYPIQLWSVLLINAATYALVGLVLEAFRHRSKLPLVA
jgi:hypothetical protein